MGRVLVCLAAGRVFPGCHDTKRPWFVEVCLRSLSFRLSGFFSPSPVLFRRSMVLQSFSLQTFFSKLFCGSYGINLSMGRNTGRGKVAYSWISPNPAKARPTLGVCCCCCCCCCCGKEKSALWVLVILVHGGDYWI